MKKPQHGKKQKMGNVKSGSYPAPKPPKADPAPKATKAK
jgi:hypothetical protein